MVTRKRGTTDDFSVGDKVLFRAKKGAKRQLGTIARVRDFSVDIALNQGRPATNIDKALVELRQQAAGRNKKIQKKQKQTFLEDDDVEVNEDSGESWSDEGEDKEEDKSSEEDESSEEGESSESEEETTEGELTDTVLEADEKPKKKLQRSTPVRKRRVTGPRSGKMAKKSRGSKSAGTTTPGKKKSRRQEKTPPRNEKRKAVADQTPRNQAADVARTPSKQTPKSPVHHRSAKKNKREYFTKEEVKALMKYVHEGEGDPAWAKLKKRAEDETGLFVNRTSLDLKDKYRNLENRGLAGEIKQRLKDNKDFDDLLEKSVVTPGKKENFHFRSEKKRKRVPWSEEEVACLTAGVSTFGTAWTKIKDEYAENLKSRTTLDLKDKWRNIRLAEARLKN